VRALEALHPETRYRVLAEMLERLKPGLVPQRDHIRLVENALESAKPNVDVTLPRGLTARRTYDRMSLNSTPAPEAIPGLFAIALGRNQLEAFGIVLDAEVIEVGRERFLTTVRQPVSISTSSGRSAYLSRGRSVVP
jgi:hypothetical protein